jgi:hypothetical protein
VPLTIAALYVKQVTDSNDLILNVVNKSRLELSKSYEDRWPLIKLRKQIQHAHNHQHLRLQHNQAQDIRELLHWSHYGQLLLARFGRPFGGIDDSLLRRA